MASKTALAAARIAIGCVVVASIGWALATQWRQYSAQPLRADPHWGFVLASGAIFLATYAVLIQTWRVMLAEWNARLSFWRAARIWTISSLYRYVPGKLWTIGAMGVMAKGEGVSPAAAAGSSALNVIVNIAAGAAIALATGWRAVDKIKPGAGPIMLGLTVAAAIGLCLLPATMPRVVAWLARVTGRDLPAVSVPPRVIAYAVAGNLLAWLMYGVAFDVFVRGILGEAAGALSDYIAVYTASYVLGYVVLVLPAGIGVRDASMAAALTALGLMTKEQALLIAGASRVWLTVLELVPGLSFIGHDALRRRANTSE